MVTLLYIAISFLFFTSLVLARNLFEFEALSKTKLTNTGRQPKVSICIPARNEAQVIERCVTSALKQNYEHFEVIVLDDQSTDGTTQILEQLSRIISNLTHIKGEEKPEDWLGKPWACHQLSEHASGEILIYIDADVWLKPDVIPKTVQQLQEIDCITIWPEQVTETFWEKQAIPLIYFALYTLLPAKYVERKPRWLPAKLASNINPLFAAACGQFIAFNRTAYEYIKGHQSVKDRIVDDVELAKNIKRNGLSLKMLHGADSVYCRMYTSGSEVWHGLRKNFFVGFNQNSFSFGLMAFLHIVVFVFPVFSLIYGFAQNSNELIILSAIPLTLIVIQRSVLNFIFKWDIYSAFTHQFGVLWFQALGVRCLVDYFTKKPVRWKGREIN